MWMQALCIICYVVVSFYHKCGVMYNARRTKLYPRMAMYIVLKNRSHVSNAHIDTFFGTSSGYSQGINVPADASVLTLLLMSEMEKLLLCSAVLLGAFNVVLSGAELPGEFFSYLLPLFPSPTLLL